jgi:hypothetical protein
MFYLEYQSFSYKLFIRKKETKEDVSGFKITYAVCHPALTFSCLQPYLMFGTNNGTIMKFNSNKDPYGGKTFKYQIHNVLNSRIIVNEDSNFPEEMGNYLGIEQNPPGTFDGKNVYSISIIFKPYIPRILQRPQIQDHLLRVLDLPRKYS